MPGGRQSKTTKMMKKQQGQLQNNMKLKNFSLLLMTVILSSSLSSEVCVASHFRPPPPPPLQQPPTTTKRNQASTSTSSSLTLFTSSPFVLRGVVTVILQQHANNNGRDNATTTSTSFKHLHPKKPHLEFLNLEEMSLALRLTCEINRRLINGVTGRKTGCKISGQMQHEMNHHHHHQVGDSPFNVHPSRSWYPPVPDELTTSNNNNHVGNNYGYDDSHLTLFHAKAPREIISTKKKKHLSSLQQYHARKRGADRWGPELLPFLKHVVSLLLVDADSTVNDNLEYVVPLAMIYLDRACSLETQRSNDVEPCPYCSPRTVHRLSLVAIILAFQALQLQSPNAIDENNAKMLERIQDSLGIPASQLQQMITWMKASLGKFGTFVTESQIQSFQRTWDSVFDIQKSEKQSSQLHAPAVPESITHQSSQHHHHHHQLSSAESHSTPHYYNDDHDQQQNVARDHSWEPPHYHPPERPAAYQEYPQYSF